MTTARGYAHDTSVPVDRSKQQIEALLRQHGAEGFNAGWQGPTGDDPGWDAVQFLWKGRTIRFRLDRPKASRYTQRALEQRNRQRWRILFLVIKAKLEAVTAGVSVFEDEFLSFIVTGSGQTIGEVLVPCLLAGKGPLMLDAPRGDA